MALLTYLLAAVCTYVRSFHAALGSRANCCMEVCQSAHHGCERLMRACQALWRIAVSASGMCHHRGAALNDLNGFSASELDPCPIPLTASMSNDPEKVSCCGPLPVHALAPRSDCCLPYQATQATSPSGRKVYRGRFRHHECGQTAFLPQEEDKEANHKSSEANFHGT